MIIVRVNMEYYSCQNYRNVLIMVWNPCQKSHMVLVGHTWCRKDRMHATMFLFVRQSFTLRDKVSACATKFQNG